MDRQTADRVCADIRDGHNSRGAEAEKTRQSVRPPVDAAGVLPITLRVRMRARVVWMDITFAEGVLV